MDTGLHRPKSLPYSTNHHSKIQKKRFDNRSLSQSQLKAVFFNDPYKISLKVTFTCLKS